MPDSAAIGANFSTYTGDPALGGGTLGAIRIDTRPLEDLARYTFLYNKSEYDQRQKDAEKAAEEIADYMSYDLINGIPKFSKILQDKFDNLNKFIYDNNGEPINYRNRKLWTEYQRLRGDLGNDIAAAKLNEVIFMARKKAVEDEINPLEKQRKQKNLDNDIAALNIRDRLKHDDQYDVTPVAVGTVPIIEIETTEIGRNIMGTATTKLPDMRLARNTAQGIAGGLLKISEQQGQFADQYEAAVASGKLEAVLSSQNFNAALQSYKSDPKYLNTDGTLNIDKIIAADNGIVSRNLRNIKVFNQNMREIRGQIANGYFKDKFNKELTFSNDASGLNESDYADININDGYSPDEIVLTRMFAQTPVTPPRKIKLDETDLAIKKGQLSVAWMNANKKASAGDADKRGVQTPALLFGQHIERVKNFIQKNSGKDLLIVPYEGTDETTKKALGISGKKGFITYGQDGSIRINTDSKGGGGTPVTLDQLKQGYMDVVKSGLSEKGIQAEGFLESAEKEFDAIWNTRSGELIWNNWGTPKQEDKTQQDTKKEYKLNGKTFSLEKVEKAAKQSGMTVDEYIKKFGLQ